MRINLKNNPFKFHPDPIWKDEDLSHVHTGVEVKIHKKSKYFDFLSTSTSTPVWTGL